MADAALIDEIESISDEEKFRRKNLQMAVEGDDWSGEIDKQTAETISGYEPTSRHSESATQREQMRESWGMCKKG